MRLLTASHTFMSAMYIRNPSTDLRNPRILGTILDILPKAQVPASAEASTAVQHSFRTRRHGREVLSYGRSGWGQEGRPVHRLVVGMS